MPSRNHGLTFIDILVVLGIAFFLIALAMPATTRLAQRNDQQRCADNLRQIGQAMQLYAQDNLRLGGPYPRTHYNRDAAVIVGASGTDLKAIPAAKGEPFAVAARDAAAPVGIGYNNVPAALFLLLRTQSISSNVFVCPSSKAVPDDFQRGGVQRELLDCANFAGDGDNGPNVPPGGRVTAHLSYGYANPYPNPKAISRGFRMNNAMNPEFALMADIGPGITGDADNVYRTNDINAAQVELRWMNSNNHGKEGQNVLFADGHVAWFPDVFVGAKRNHIYVVDSDSDYTANPPVSDETNRKWYTGQGARGTTTATDSKPIDAADSVCLPWDD